MSAGYPGTASQSALFPPGGLCVDIEISNNEVVTSNLVCTSAGRFPEAGGVPLQDTLPSQALTALPESLPLCAQCTTTLNSILKTWQNNAAETERRHDLATATLRRDMETMRRDMDERHQKELATAIGKLEGRLMEERANITLETEKRILDEKNQSNELLAKAKNEMVDEMGKLSKQVRFLMSYRAIVIAAQVINIHLGTQPRPVRQPPTAVMDAYKQNIPEYRYMLVTVISKVAPCDLSLFSSNLDEVLRTRHLFAHPSPCDASASLESFDQLEVDQLISALKAIVTLTPAEIMTLIVLENYKAILNCPKIRPRRQIDDSRGGGGDDSAAPGPKS